MVAKMSGTVPGTPQYNSLKYNHVLEYYQQYQKTMQQQQRQQQLQQQYQQQQQQRQQHQKQEQFRHQQQQFEEQQRLQHQQQQFDEQQRLQQHRQQQQQQLRQQYEEYQQNYDVDYEEPERRWMVSGGMGDELVAKYDYTAQDDLELSLTKNEKLILLDDAKQWWKVQNSLGNSGFVPSNFVKRVRPSLLSSLRNTLGRRKGNHVQHSLRNGSGGRDGGGGGADGENNGLATVESQFCDKCPAVAKYAYTAQQRDELSLSKGDRVMVLEKSSDGWWKGCKDDGHSGWFPSNYVQEEADNNTYADPADRGSGDSGASPPTLETVAALYPYTSDNTEELNFAKDDELEIIEKPLEDPEWWRARNRLGETGLIPRNYVQTVAVGGGAATSSQSSSSLSAHSQGASSSRTPSGGGGGAGGRARYNLTGPFAHKDWFFGSITRGHAEGLLNTSAKLGDFLIRESETNAGDFSISLKAPEKNKHFRVVCENGMFCIGPQTFDSLDDLVQHYKKHPIFRHGSEKLYLIKPFVPPDISEGEEDELVV